MTDKPDFASADDGYFRTDEEGECRECGASTDWTDYISWVCPRCQDV